MLSPHGPGLFITVAAVFSHNPVHAEAMEIGAGSRISADHSMATFADFVDFLSV